MGRNNSTARLSLFACINSARIILLVLLCYSVVAVTSLGVVKTSLSLQTSLTSSLQPSWWGSCDASNLPYDSAFRVLVKYHEKYGDLVIPRRFIVPATNEWPTEWHGVKLARQVYNRKWWTKHIAKNNDRVSQLNKIGFVWERLQPEWNLFMEAMVTYRSIYGDVMVKATFVVPRDNDEWSKGCWDLPLGNVVHRLRLRHDFLTGDTAIERKNQLDGLGFVWDVSEYNFKKFLTALRIFSKLEQEEHEHMIMPSTIRVPSNFVVPSDDYRWPIILWNYRLGTAVRQKQLYVKGNRLRQQALEEIGFRWSGNATLGWLDVVHAAAIYSQMHGRVLNPPLQFVVPSPPTPDSELDGSWPWPERLWGLKLGQRLKDVRVKGAYLKGPDAHIRKAQLDNLGFVWTPKRGRRKRS
eukprot:scaffold3016_cov146-Skeletonema_menzelii.AAC.2